MTVKLLTEHHLEFLSAKGGCAGSSESKLIKMPHCWKPHVAAQMTILLDQMAIFTKSVHHHIRTFFFYRLVPRWCHDTLVKQCLFISVL